MKKQGLYLILFVLMLGGCASQPIVNQTTQPKSDHKQLVRNDFSQCQSEAMAMDRSAREQKSAAQYHRAAVLFEHCVKTFSNYPNVIPADEIMQLQALSILDYLKSGEIIKATNQLELMRTGFPNHDLYMADGSSFVDTITRLLTTDGSHSSKVLLNTSKLVNSEYQRSQYWLTH